MFTPSERSSLRSELLEAAARDPRICAAAITGSAAAEREDKWSDIDLAFGIADAGQVATVVSEWSARMYARHHALHHYEINFGAWVYRAFLLSSTLQVDLAFVADNDFRPLAPTFQIVFGTAKEEQIPPTSSPASIIGLCWLYALHARSAIARGKLWQAESMISGIRNGALSLACIRHGLPVVHQRGTDNLPEFVTKPFEASLVRSLDSAELARAFRSVMINLFSEIPQADQSLADRLQPVLEGLVDSSD